MSLIIWFTGLSGAGKSTLCCAVQSKLKQRQIPVSVLDADVVRQHLSRDLGYSPDDRTENIRRISHAAKQLSQGGSIVLVAAISPYQAIRAEIRRQHAFFIEVFVNAPLDVCERRDPKGLYRKARAGLIKDFTGISAPYENPIDPDIECKTDKENIETSSAKVLSVIEQIISTRRST